MLQFVPQYYVEILKQDLLTNQPKIHEAIEQQQLDQALKLLNQQQSPSIWISSIYLILYKHDLEQNSVNRFVKVIEDSNLSEMSEHELLAFTQICQQIMNIELIKLLHKYNLSGWIQLSHKIHLHLRKSIHPKVPSIFINYFINQNIELLEQHEKSYDEDLVWTLHDFRTFYQMMPTDIDHPYYKLLKISIYVRMLDLEKVPCPISPQTIPIQYPSKLENILKQVIPTPHKECLDLYVFCLIDVGLFKMVIQHLRNQLAPEQIYQIRTSFIKHAIQNNYSVDVEIYQYLEELEKFDEEFKQLIYFNNSLIYEKMSTFNEIWILNGLIHNFNNIQSQQRIIKQLALDNTQQSLKALWILHLDGANSDLNTDHQKHFKIKNFKFLNIFHLIKFKNDSDFQHLIEALKVIAICIWTDRDVKQEDFESKLFLVSARKCITVQNCSQIFQLLFGISSGVFENQYETHYLKIQIPYFLELIIILLFEQNIDLNLKEFYLNQFIILTQNLENVLIILKGQIIERLIVYLRIENQFQEKIIQILINCIKVRFQLQYLQSIALFMSPYQSLIMVPYFDDQQKYESYKKISKMLGIPKQAIESGSLEQQEQFYQSINNKDLFIKNSIQLLYCLKEIVSIQNDQYYYFTGHESGIVVRGKIQLETQNNSFSIILQFKFQIASATLLNWGNQDVSFSISIEDSQFLIIKFRYQSTTKVAKYVLKYLDNFIVINFQTSKQFFVNINGIDVLATQSDQFDNFILPVLNFISVGAKFSDQEQFQNSFRGEMRMLYIIDSNINAEDIYILEKKSQNNSRLFQQLLKMQLQGRILCYLSTQSQKQDLQYDGNLHQRNQIILENCQYLIIRGKRQKQNTISKFMDKFFQQRKSSASLEVTSLIPKNVNQNSKNVFFLENTTLLDVMKSYGNLDILFFPLQFVNDQQFVIAVLQLLNTVIQKFGDDISIQNYLRSDSEFKGIKVLGYLLTVFMKNQGCTKQLLQNILNLYHSLLHCQIIQALRNDCMSIYHEFEYWQYCQYNELLFLYDYLFEQLQHNEELYSYYKDKLNCLYYILQVQLSKYQPQKGEFQIFQQIRKLLIKCILFLMYNSFFQIQYNNDDIVPVQMIFREKKNEKYSTEKLIVFKNEIILLLNYISLKSVQDLAVILCFMVKKPQNCIIQELLSEMKCGSSSAQKEFNIDTIQTQFIQKNESEDTLLVLIFKIIYGVIIEMIDQKSINDHFLAPLIEILIKVQILQINYEHKLLELQQPKNVQQLKKAKECTLIKSLFNKIIYILYEHSNEMICSHNTYQVLINLSQLVLKQELGLESEVLDLLLQHFRKFNIQTKELIIEFLILTSTYTVFMTKLCDHKDLTYFINELIAIEIGQALINRIVLHHIENIAFSARKIVRLFQKVEQSNNQFMKVLQNILNLQIENPNLKQNQKSAQAMIDLFMLLPTSLILNKNIILNDPELFIRVFDQYILYLEKQEILYSFCMDTEFVGFYEYVPIPFFIQLSIEIQRKYLYANGGIMGTVLFILFYSLELLMSKKEAKSLLIIWKKLITQKQKSTNRPLQQQSLIVDEVIPNVQTKIQKIKIKQQKQSLIQKVKQNIFGDYQQTQYDKYFQDIHLIHILKFQLLSHQYSHSEQLFEIFSELQFKPDNFINFACFWNIIEQKRVLGNMDIQFQIDQFNLKEITTDITIEGINNKAYIIINQFNQQNQRISQAIKENLKIGNDAKKFIDMIQKANTTLKYLELFKDSDLIKRSLTYMKLYAYRQLQFCQEIAILLNLHSIQIQNQDQINNQVISLNQQCQQNNNEFSKLAYNLFSQYRQDSKQTILRFENEQLIQQLIIQFKVKLHFKQNTHKRGLWYYMNYGDAHLYENLNQVNYDTFLELLGKERYSINSYEDSLRRKMFLKVFAKQKKQYEHIQLINNIQIVFNDLFNTQQQIQQNCKCMGNENQQFLAELITQRGFYRGKIRITSDYLMFENFGLESQELEIQYKFQKESLLKAEKQKLIPLSQIKEVFTRMYLAQSTAIELFTSNNKTYFFNLLNNRSSVLKLLGQSVNVITNPCEQFKKSGIMEKWRKGEITNFQYLIEINKYSGRTYNDLNQYPIFPWVIANYVDFDIQNKEHFRRLDLPIGALNQKRLENFLERFKEADPEDMNMYFIYGTHYSHSAIVMSLLMRMEPFASLHQELQSGKFDKADRLFHSLEQQWYSALNSSSDVKELIPEFYYFGEFLKNKNKFDLGQLQSGTTVGDVTLPSYINTKSPEELIFLNRQALESELVSSSLNNWIDLIFGYKSGLNAQKYNNLYHRLTYSSYVQQLLEKTEDEVKKEQYITQVNFYGQIPQQLFKKEHPQKTQQKLYDQGPIIQFKFITQILSRSSNIIDQFFCNEKYFVVLTNEQEIIVYNMEHRIISHKIPKDFSNQESKLMPFNSNNVFLLFDDSLVVAGYVDNSVKVYSLKDLKQTYQVSFHTKVVTCLGQSANYLLCGSMDTRVSVWEWTLQHQPEFILYGHQNEVSIIQVDSILEIILSYDVKGDILLHTMKGVFLKLIETSLQDCSSIRLHPSGFILLSSLNLISIYTLQGEPYIQRELQDQIINVNVINEYSPELLITTLDGGIFITSIILLKLYADFTGYCLKQYKLDEMEMKLETNQIKKVKEISGKSVEFINALISYSQFNQTQAYRVLIIGFQNGQVISVYEQPKQTSLL
ncbi:unnamed protein product (macronuclear) [Paramecium tetraurelia]|uniref:BEACH domain-containing protein n=1 Tax=Paramecium tetraurelia TaxID=5888 RepID=A0BH39_PARTE|nr:uncharacterized protein GSPATT00028891001 [Paramecium tetraurelia]CAK57856.1 unnamed protein product [Paramecium tetraurelia]|eukprot:XP_001425254.1 hypothetical protein (macronuclear) [Paramecium tetraurelia strain d4-2]